MWDVGARVELDVAKAVEGGRATIEGETEAVEESRICTGEREFSLLLLDVDVHS